MRRQLCAAIAATPLVFVLGTSTVWAQTAGDHSPSTTSASATKVTTLNTIIVTGTRESGITAANSAAPVQVVSAAALKTLAGNPDLLAALAQVVPSFTAQAFGNDMAGQTLQARLRGLSCNDVLVLVNGKRRHTAANIELDSGPFQGCAGTDLDFIPIAAIERIEVLTGGAAAKYGSDAIAGVINIILKKDNAGGDVTATYGGYMDGGGGTRDASANLGFEPVPNSYFNITAEAHNHGPSNRSAIDERVINPVNLAKFPDSNMPKVPDYPYLGAEEGDAHYELKLLALNAGFALPDGMRFYSFATYGYKNAKSFQKYRLPGKLHYADPVTGITTYPFPFGFDPLEASKETDYSVTAGIKGRAAGWHWDLSSTYGRDHFNAFTLNSANSGVFNSTGEPTPLDYYDGYLQTTQWTSNLDVDRDFDVGLAGPLNVAWGLEYRRGSYGIGAGIPLSWLDGGAQSFPGFTPTDAGTHFRHVEGAYIDVAAQPIGPLHLDAAARYEHFSDFGSAAIGALTARYDFSPRFAVRGTVSNGFRAPTLAEEYFSSTNVTPTTAFVQLPPNSAGGRLIGLGDGLRPVHSMNYSVGLIWRPRPAVIGTFDLYVINLTNRIVATGNLIGTLNGVTQLAAPAINAAIAANGNQLDPAVLATGSTGVTLFANGIDTRTRGADLAFDFPSHYAFGDIDWSVGANFNLTEITRVPTTPVQLAGATLYDATALSDLTTASPRYVLNFGALWTRGKLAVNVVEQIYGKSSEWENDDGDNPSNTPEYFQSTIGVTPITNLDVSYRLTPHFTASFGALNLFNRYPDKYNSTLLAHYDDFRFGDTLGVFQYPMFSPFGIDGGYYYVRGTFHW